MYITFITSDIYNQFSDFVLWRDTLLKNQNNCFFFCLTAFGRLSGRVKWSTNRVNQLFIADKLYQAKSVSEGYLCVIIPLCAQKSHIQAIGKVAKFDCYYQVFICVNYDEAFRYVFVCNGYYDWKFSVAIDLKHVASTRPHSWSGKGRVRPLKQIIGSQPEFVRCFLLHINIIMLSLHLQ